MNAALGQEEKDLGDWRKIYPVLMGIYFQWWDGKHDDAIAAVDVKLTDDEIAALEAPYTPRANVGF